MTGNDAVRLAAQRLRTAGVDDPVRDARILLAFAVGVPADRLTLYLADPVPPTAQDRLEAALLARERRKPVSQITGQRLFWGRSFRVTPDVLDPRPETEILVAAAIEHPFHSLLDLGTGSGCILLSCLAETPAAFGTGVDLSAAALEVARDNADRLGLSARCTLVQSDWCTSVDGLFDLITSNPPYIAADEMAALAPEVRLWEPELALTPGGDGLDAYRAIARQAPQHLHPLGRLIVEIGPTQGAAVAGFLRDAGLTDVTLRRDLDGRDRIVIGKKPAK
jgi:release factor glutamine methyltransferase